MQSPRGDAKCGTFQVALRASLDEGQRFGFWEGNSVISVKRVV